MRPELAPVAGLLEPAERRRDPHGRVRVHREHARLDGARDARAVREEIFGPVAAVLPFEDEADAIALANDTIYGLSGSIWTRDGARALRVARALETGVLSVNSNSSVRVQTPFGGMKMSGFGRELGMAGMDGYAELKNVFVATEG